MRAGVALEVPELDGSVVGAADHHFLGKLDQFGDVRGVLVRQVPYEVASCDVPHLDRLVEASAQQSHVVLQQHDRPDEVQVASHRLEAG